MAATFTWPVFPELCVDILVDGLKNIAPLRMRRSEGAERPSYRLLLSMTLVNALDPFLTIKEVGKGTGLGLSTVYGIARQIDAFVNIYSESDQGTAFLIVMDGHEVVMSYSTFFPLFDVGCSMLDVRLFGGHSLRCHLAAPSFGGHSVVIRLSFGRLLNLCRSVSICGSTTLAMPNLMADICEQNHVLRPKKVILVT